MFLNKSPASRDVFSGQGSMRRFQLRGGGARKARVLDRNEHIYTSSAAQIGAPQHPPVLRPVCGPARGAASGAVAAPDVCRCYAPGTRSRRILWKSELYTQAIFLNCASFVTHRLGRVDDCGS